MSNTQGQLLLPQHNLQYNNPYAYLRLIDGGQRFPHIEQSSHSPIQNRINKIAPIPHHNTIHHHLPHKFPSQYAQGFRVKGITPYYYFLEQFCELVRIFFVLVEWVGA